MVVVVVVVAIMEVATVVMDTRAAIAEPDILGASISHFQQQTATKVALHIKFMTQTFLQLLIDFISVI